MKFGWGNHFAPDDEERLAAIREGLGPDTKLMVDFGCPAYWTPGWNATAAIRAARILERYGVFFIEEPMPPQDVAGHRAVADAVDVNVATGESLTLHRRVRALHRRARPRHRPARCGADRASRNWSTSRDGPSRPGSSCVPHSPWSALCVAAHSQACLTVRNSALIEYPAMASFEEGSTTAAATAFYQWELVEHPPVLDRRAAAPVRRSRAWVLAGFARTPSSGSHAAK